MIITLVMIFGSLGFIIIGLFNLFSKKLKEFFRSSGLYNDVDSFIKHTAIFNFIIGIVGIILGFLNYVIHNQSTIIIVIYIATIFILNIIQKIILKKYKNI